MKKQIIFIMMSAGIALTVSACRDRPAVELAEPDQTEVPINLKEVSNEETAENGETAIGDGTVEPAVPISVTIEHVTDTLSEEKGNVIYQYPKFYLDEEDGISYPELKAAFESYNSRVESNENAVLDDLESYYEAYVETYTEDTWCQITSEITARALRADSNAVSILYESYDYEGGVHGYHYTGGMNFDTGTGKELTLGDVVEDKDAFIELVSEAFSRDYGDDGLVDAGEMLKEWDFASNENILWTIDPTCVSIYFAPYVLGSYADGEQVVSVFFDEAPEVFCETYRMACEDYVLPITSSKPVSILSSSGERENISVDLETVRYDDYDEYQVGYTIGDTKLMAQWSCYGADSYLVHVDGKNYIYAFQSMDNDDTCLSVVDADNKSFDDEKNMNVCRKVYWKNSDTQMQSETVQGSTAFTNPIKYELGFRVDVLGTYNVYGNCHTGSDGYPVFEDAIYYTSGAGAAFRTIKETECDIVDKEGNITGKAVIPADSFLAVVRTDGENIADIQIIDSSFIEKQGSEEWPVYVLNKEIEEIVDLDGTIYRVTTDRSDYPYKVNGEEEGSLFEGVLYTG